MDTGTVTLILVVAIVVSLLKPFLELSLKPASPLHDTAIRLLAIVVGLVAALTDYLVHTTNWQNGVLLESTLGRGLAAGVGAVLTYHLLTSSVWDVLTPGQATTSASGAGSGITTIPPYPVGTTVHVPSVFGPDQGGWTSVQTVTPPLVPAKVEKAEIVTPVQVSPDPMPTPPQLPDATPPTPGA